MQLEIYTGLMQSALRGKSSNSSYYSLTHPALAVNDVIKNALSYSQRTVGTVSTDECTSLNEGRLSTDSASSNNDRPAIVSFNDSVSVVLVPTRDEYIKYNLFSNLWYSENDYKVFTADAMREIDIYINNNVTDLKSALTGLYQSKSEANPLKLSHINFNSSNSSSNSNSDSPDDEYGNFVEFDSLPIRQITSTQSSFTQEDEPQFVLDL
jgi:hypothetical protein